MQTDTLTTLLAQNLEPVAPRRATRRYLLGITAGALVGLLLMTVTLRVNPALIHEATQRAFWLRELYCAVLGGLAVLTLARLARPGARLGVGPAGIGLAVLCMWILGAVVLLSDGSQRRVQLLFGTTWSVCPLLISLLAVPLFAAYVWILKDLAPTRLRWTGATAGFAAGSMAALIYTLHCPELAPPFIATWYLLGMLVPACLGAVLGPRLLRW